jgi:GT2 family glycosyltransferase
MNEIKLSIIIITFQAELYIEACINSILRQTYNNYNIIIVDNGSSDNTKFYIANFIERYSNIHLIENRKNLGFARANNIGISYALNNLKSDYVFLLNQDTTTQKDLLENLVYWANEDNSAVLGPKILIKKNGRIWWIGTKVFKIKDLFTNSRLSLSCQIDKEQSDNFFMDRPTEVDAIVGCAVLIPKKILFDVGCFDEDFFMYGEDLDFSLRVRKKGYKLLIVSEAIVYHDVHLEKEAFNIEDSNRVLKRYYNYLLGCIKVLYKHFPVYYTLIWFARVPFAILYEVSKRIMVYKKIKDNSI